MTQSAILPLVKKLKEFVQSRVLIDAFGIKANLNTIIFAAIVITVFWATSMVFFWAGEYTVQHGSLPPLFEPSLYYTLLVLEIPLLLIGYWLGKRSKKESIDYDALAKAVAMAVHEEFEQERKRRETSSS